MALLFAGLLRLPVATVAADAPLSADEVRERRLFREERPLWRAALALPAEALSVLAWPVKESLLWIEDVNLPARVVDAARCTLHAPDGRGE